MHCEIDTNQVHPRGRFRLPILLRLLLQLAPLTPQQEEPPDDDPHLPGR